MHIEGLAIGINPGIKECHYEIARKVDPHVPIFSSETWLGWYTHWGDTNWAGKSVEDAVE